MTIKSTSIQKMLPTQQQLETKLRDATQLDSTPDTRTKRAVVEGTPATAIVDYAKENGGTASPGCA